MNRVMKISLSVLMLVLVAGGSFYGGLVYGKGQALVAEPGARGGFPGGGMPPAGQAGQGATGAAAQGGMLFGEIKQIADGTLVVSDSNGKQTQVHVTDTTLVQKQAAVTVADLKQGETVMVSGSQASDGSITARSVQVAPAGRFAGNAPAAQSAGNAQGSSAQGGNPPPPPDPNR